MIVTDRLHLSTVREDDWEGYAPILRAPETSRFSDLPKNPSDKRITALIKWMVRISEDGKGAAWMIRAQGRDEIIGCIRINQIEKKTAIGNVGYELSQPFWGKGLMTEAVQAVADHCFNTLALFRLEAWTHLENESSQRVLLKAGFQKEGVQRQKFVDGANRHDLCLFGRLVSD